MKKETSSCSLSVHSGKLTVTGLNFGDWLYVFDMSGILVVKHNASSNASGLFSYQLTPGTYVVSVDNRQAIKSRKFTVEL